MEKETIINDPIIGKSFFFRTVTFHLIGRVVRRAPEFGKSFVELSYASWVADSGRFSTAIEEGTLSEVEPIKHSCYVNLETCTDIIEWVHTLPVDKQ